VSVFFLNGDLVEGKLHDNLVYQMGQGFRILSLVLVCAMWAIFNAMRSTLKFKQNLDLIKRKIDKFGIPKEVKQL